MVRNFIRRYHWKNEKNRYKILKLLLENGANRNEIEFDRCTAFVVALKGQSLKVIKLLLKHGANIQLEAGFGGTAIHLAAVNPNVDVIEFIIDQGFDIDCSSSYHKYTQPCSLGQNVDPMRSANFF